MTESRSQGILDMLSIDRDILKARRKHKGTLSQIITYSVDTKDSKVDCCGLALFEEFHEQVVQITRVVVGKQADDDIDIPRKFPLHSKSV